MPNPAVSPQFAPALPIRGCIAPGGSPEDYGRGIRAEMEKRWKIIR